ncbi:acetyl-CoA carboxylase biotin carboxyl carrier protein subunit [Flavobacterium sp. 14A]|uniref:acetyl-CoA carboxylase biotin carboxyl carrier protein subunit n=1 Tax=Flavobacterium sp. 14A TaxID=2735896 RepID=UPI0015705316|nr:acetyl-CoA carboxylase biotin carboxyl carrier protein subunit [Flavobacterium sp. 14A]NRT11261.1 biotin carboxyl carrier protein [Flavobacterium sp. 14A]
MRDNYKISVNDSFFFTINKEEVSKFDAVNTGGKDYHALHNSTPYKATIESSNFHQKSYTVKVNSNLYTVAIADDLDLLIKELGFEVGLSKQINAIKAPMPGLILEINVVVGQTVKEKDPLLILEAMKMENSFQSPRDGVIKSIAVATGDAVDKGQLLIEFE